MGAGRRQRRRRADLRLRPRLDRRPRDPLRRTRASTACAAVLLLALVLSLPTAAAAVTVQQVEVPERTAAAKPFEVRVRLANEGPARSVHLFGALYDAAEGKAPCGQTTDPSFRTFTHLVQETIRLPADGEIEHPAEGGRWLHRYGVEDADATPADAEFCVFVAEASGGPVIRYEAYGTTLLSVRAQNAPPQPTFTFEPRAPAVREDVRFVASAVDADGDPVTFRWDFGRFDASGRAVGEGETATHAFYPEGSYAVTLTASDGIDAMPASRTLQVVAAPDGASQPPGDEGEPARGTPLVAALAGCALVAAALARRGAR